MILVGFQGVFDGFRWFSMVFDVFLVLFDGISWCFSMFLMVFDGF